MMTYTHEVGRLVEVRHLPPAKAADFDAAAVSSFRKLLDSVPRAIVCVDLRWAKVLPQELADLLPESMRRTRGYFEREAVIATSWLPTMVMQVRRVAQREAGDPARRTFTDTNAAIAWLDEVLGPEERDRLRAFLGEMHASRAG